ncbi:MAG: type II toxin-antitoxin system HigB family toxin [SAR324 cluster bacterium]|nr:type II toxin-antitoxin system HigB family toxin [SAR324 cluster bacterium]MBF0352586.1 type II toxin-antitoxin system HigB family toxin [SAR324 cluster bacterium]
MHIISKKKIEDFSKIHADAKNALLDWYKILRNREFSNYVELKLIFPSADMVGRRTVFNIGGNKYRLIARINFLHKKVFILHILSHVEYDKEKWKE